MNTRVQSKPFVLKLLLSLEPTPGKLTASCLLAVSECKTCLDWYIHQKLKYHSTPTLVQQWQEIQNGNRLLLVARDALWSMAILNLWNSHVTPKASDKGDVCNMGKQALPFKQIAGKGSGHDFKVVQKSTFYSLLAIIATKNARNIRWLVAIWGLLTT